ncbi:TPA: hypothetical protein PFD71_003191 [Vibrio cholerae]|uniref:hypothetical protein n=1 Tax=Vibrio cholerae TaxID=666 RepID=UPI002055517D|nr:hypothetical protein 1992IndM4_0845 [Vibrio phage ICP1]HDG1611301.1 hypothetical protein [Vibrio cholerae]
MRFLTNFKWYRKSQGGKWWLVKSYDNPHTKFWISEKYAPSFPEFDGLFMEDIGCAYWDSWFSYERGHSFYGWPHMENDPTEVYVVK